MFGYFIDALDGEVDSLVPVKVHASEAALVLCDMTRYTVRDIVVNMPAPVVYHETMPMKFMRMLHPSHHATPTGHIRCYTHGCHRDSVNCVLVAALQFLSYLPARVAGCLDQDQQKYTRPGRNASNGLRLQWRRNRHSMTGQWYAEILRH